MDRRSFLTRASLGAGGLAAGAAALNAAESAPAAVRPTLIISKDKSGPASRAAELLASGARALDAALAAVAMVEDDPDDITVGLGGLPNERGVVELDASVMDGESASGGAVAALRGIRNPCRVARLVMEQTDHVLLVGEGALEFARAQGFAEENLLTERSRKIWLHWRQTLSEKDDWIAPPRDEWPQEVRDYLRTYGTVHCSVLDGRGHMAGVTSTSGLFGKMPGRVGDSPIIGAGLFTDDAVGSCGATGRGEAVILAGGSRAVVEHLRQGLSPEQAALRTLEWIADHTRVPRLLTTEGRPDFDVTFYVLDRQGRAASAALYSGASCTVVVDGRKTVREAAYLWKRKPRT